ncbi:MAG: ATP-dependent Clp protease proteolytic subunit [Clostridiaceae bacterium]|nr:ATP-dependent Clp protease proteolytic subunit [Clostridiaceae bacterium]
MTAENYGDSLKEYGITVVNGVAEDKSIWVVSIIGEIEGHELASEKMKTTSYEHMLPMLTRLQEEEQVEGVLFLINTVGGDVSCGLALAEFIASLTKPTVALVIGDSHSIGVPLSVAPDYTVISPSATVIIHPVRMNGTVLGAPQTYEYFQLIQDRITGFIAKHSGVTQEQLKKWMVAPGILSRDLGTILVGEDAVKAGLFQETGGIGEAMEALRQRIRDAVCISQK